MRSRSARGAPSIPASLSAGTSGGGGGGGEPNRFASNHSDLAVLDAQNIEAGPIALFKMPVRVKASFHGIWVPEETMTTGLYRYP